VKAECETFGECFFISTLGKKYWRNQNTDKCCIYIIFKRLV